MVSTTAFRQGFIDPVRSITMASKILSFLPARIAVMFVKFDDAPITTLDLLFADDAEIALRRGSDLDEVGVLPADKDARSSSIVSRLDAGRIDAGAGVEAAVVFDFDADPGLKIVTGASAPPPPPLALASVGAATIFDFDADPGLNIAAEGTLLLPPPPPPVTVVGAATIFDFDADTGLKV